MFDPRNRKLAETICDYSLGVKPGEIVWIDIAGVDALGLGHDLVEQVSRMGGIPYFCYAGKEILRPFFEGASESQVQQYGAFQKAIMERVQCYVAIRGDRNSFEYSGLDKEHHQYFGKHYLEPVHYQTRLKKRWVVLRYPNDAMAAAAQMPTSAFAEFYYQVCGLDYAKMSEAIKPLKALMERTDKVRIIGPGETNLTFSIKGIPAVPCDGKMNIPDGECFTAPVKTSMNGVIQYNTRTLYQSTVFNNIRFEVKDGKIVHATCEGDVAKLNQFLDTDEGARYFGEWSLAFNPYINKPILDILFDEKIYGSFHLTPGNAYEEADNGNRSNVHWDLVCIQTPEMGGGEIWFDDVLIRKDGEWTLDELQPLSRKALTS